MRWLACLVLLVGCVRARATAVHPAEQVTGGSGTGTDMSIARVAPAAREVPQATEASTKLVSVELGAMVPFTAANETTRIHVAPGVRIFGSQVGSVLWGVAVGADYVGDRRGPGFALEGSVYVGNGGGDTAIIEQALDLFAGVTLHSSRARTSIAVGPSIGLLAMPGGSSVAMFGLGLRLTSSRGHAQQPASAEHR